MPEREETMEQEAFLAKVSGMLSRELSPVMAELAQLKNAQNGPPGGKPVPCPNCATLQEQLTAQEAQHQAGLCNENACAHCSSTITALTLDIVNKIEDKLPGTKDALAKWQWEHQPVEVTAD